MNKLYLIPLIIAGYVFVYPMVESGIDCPSAMTSPEDNTNCTLIKSINWEIVQVLSVYHWDGVSTTSILYGEWGDVCCYNENVQSYAADEASGKSVFPLVTLSIGMFVINKIRLNKEIYNEHR